MSSSDGNIYIDGLTAGDELSPFKLVADSSTNPTTSLITPNTTKAGYDVSKTSFVVGSDRLNTDPSSPDYDTRMFFEKSTGAFRAGTVGGDQWDNLNRGTNSAAFGDSNIASGANSFATGSDNTVSGENSFAVGLDNTVSGNRSFAAGNNNTVSGDSSCILGDNCTITGDSPIAIGSNNTGNSDYAILIGRQNSSSGTTDTIAIGQYCTASGNHSFSIGYGDSSGTNPSRNTASNTGSIAIGHNNSSTGADSVAIGEYCTSAGSNSFAIGYGTSSAQNTAGGTGNNGSIAIGNTNSSTGADSVAIGKYCTAYGDNSFAIGYGTNTSTRNNALGTGSISIGNINNVTGVNSVAIGRNNTIVSGANNSYIIGQSCSITNSSSSGAIVMGLNAQISHECARGLFWSGSSTDGGVKNMTSTYLPGSAQFDCGTSGTFAVTFDGSSVGTTINDDTGYSWASSSDINLKENLIEHTYSDTLNKIMEMPIYTYNFKTAAPGIKSIGPVAQDFNRLFPSDKDQLSIVERDMCGVALAGVKGVKLGLDNLSTSVDSRFVTNSDATSALQSRITVLESSLATASAQITAMESRLAVLEH